MRDGGLDRAFLGHPRGLGILALTEGLVGFSYYGMQSLLVLYLTTTALRPEHLGRILGFAPFRTVLGTLYGPVSGEPLAAAIVGLYGALVFATPIAGGLLADRLLGRTRTILLGAVLMTAGHFLMAFEWSLLLALGCLVVGMGCAGTTKAQVGGLYGPADPRRADAFQIYTLSVSVAVILAPLVCGTLGERYAWHWGFTAAGAGMLVGLLVYVAGRRWLPPEPVPRGPAEARSRLTASEWRTLLVLGALLPVLAVASVSNMEIFNAYLVWGRETYRLVFFGRTMPVSWLLSLDAFVGTVVIVLSMLFWRLWARRYGPVSEIAKMATGAGFSALGPLVLAAASAAAAHGRVGLGWGLAFHILNDIGFANLYPVGLALYSRLAPRQLGATVVNAYVLHLFGANLLVGALGGLLVRMPATRFWLLHAALVALAGGVLVGFGVLFRGKLALPAGDGPGVMRSALSRDALDPIEAES